MGFWSSVRDGTLAVTGTIYELADGALLGALPNELQGVTISTVGTNNNIVANALQVLPEAGSAVSGALVQTTAGLPQVGANVGQGVGNVIYYPVASAGAAVGSAVGDIGQGAGGLLGDFGSGLGKGLLPVALIGGGLLLALMFANSRTHTVQEVGRAARGAY